LTNLPSSFQKLPDFQPLPGSAGLTEPPPSPARPRRHGRGAAVLGREVSPLKRFLGTSPEAILFSLTGSAMGMSILSPICDFGLGVATRHVHRKIVFILIYVSAFLGESRFVSVYRTFGLWRGHVT
jgi:hypothetical protein